MFQVTWHVLFNGAEFSSIKANIFRLIGCLKQIIFYLRGHIAAEILYAITPWTTQTWISQPYLFCTEVDGNWTQWSVWSACSASCGNRTRNRSRQCADPAPAHGGRDCDGARTETQDCALISCPGRLSFRKLRYRVREGVVKIEVKMMVERNQSFLKVRGANMLTSYYSTLPYPSYIVTCVL